MTDVRKAVVEALVRLGDKRAVPSLLAKLDDADAEVRIVVIGALGQFGVKQAIPLLIAKLEDSNTEIGATTAMALHVLGEQSGTAAMTRLLASQKTEVRRSVVHAYARQKDISDQRLLARGFDAYDPWLDPREIVSEDRVATASLRLSMTVDQIRSRYEAMAPDLNLKLSWKP